MHQVKPSEKSKGNARIQGKAALRVLNCLAWEELKRRNPEMPEGWLPRPKHSDNSANALTRSIIAFIKLNGGQAERINTTGRPIDGTRIVGDCLGFKRQIGSVTWIPGTSAKGSADISATYKGRSIKIEVKYWKDRMSETQRQYRSSVEAAGGIYIIARTFEGFYNDWNSLFT